jgi:hypothetical protein
MGHQAAANEGERRCTVKKAKLADRIHQIDMSFRDNAHLSAPA